MLGIMLRCLVMLLILQCGDGKYCIYRCRKENILCKSWQKGWNWNCYDSCSENGAVCARDHDLPEINIGQMAVASAVVRVEPIKIKLDTQCDTDGFPGSKTWFKLLPCDAVRHCTLDENVCSGFLPSLDTNNEYAEKSLEIIASAQIQIVQGVGAAVNPAIGVGIGVVSTLAQIFNINGQNILERAEDIINESNRKLLQCIDGNMATAAKDVVEAKLAALRSDIQRFISWKDYAKEEERALYDVIVSCDRFMAEMKSLSSNYNANNLLRLLPIIKTWGALCLPYFAMQIKIEPNESKKQIHYALWKQTYQNAKDFVRNAKQKIENYYWYQCEHSARYRYDQKMKYLQQEFYDPINKWRDTIPHSLPIQSKKQIHDEIHEIHDEL
eukprot:513918_1